MSRDIALVGEGGLEPPRPCGHRHLKPARLPIPPLARVDPEGYQPPRADPRGVVRTSSAMSDQYEVPTTADLDAMFESLKNWGRWGADDERGALNHLTPARRVAAATLVRDGVLRQPRPRPRHRAVARERPARSITTCWRPATPATRNGIPGYEAARDYLGLDVHGLADDARRRAVPHVRARRDVRRATRVARCAATARARTRSCRWPTAWSGRGVLLDMPRTLGVDFLDHGEAVHGRRPGGGRGRRRTSGSRPGDILLVAWGRDARRARHAAGSTACPGCTPTACPGSTNARWRCSAATGSPTRCRSSASPTGRSRSTRSASPRWACTSSTTWR